MAGPGFGVLPIFRGQMSDPTSLQISWLLRYVDVALLLMRLLVGAVFITSGASHVNDPVTRGKSIGLPPGVTRVLGLAEIAGGIGVALGVLPQFAALGLILIMLGAIQKKIFVWRTGFWGQHGTDGWHYDLLFVAMCLVVITTGGGRYVLLS
jgi:putative oxidoreductase